MSRNKKINSPKRFEEVYAPLQPKKKAFTKLEQEKKEKKDEAIASEELTAEGTESEKKGQKWVAETYTRDEKKKQSIQDLEREFLMTKRKFTDEEYLTALGSILYYHLKTTDAPLGYSYEVEVEGKNVKAVLKDRFGRRFARGFTATGMVKYDYKAILVLEASAQETVDHYEESKNRKTDSGIYLPPSLKT